jgi:hypothetical protein
MAESKKQIENPRWQTDDLVYAAVRYLDSPTDYREYLPRRAKSKIGQNQERQEKSTVPKNDFVLLDDIPVYRLNWLWSLSLLAILLCIALLGLLKS